MKGEKITEKGMNSMLDFLPQARFTASTVIPLILIIAIGYIFLTKNKNKKISDTTEKQLKIKNLANYLAGSAIVFLISLILLESRGIADWNYTIHETFAIFINASFFILPLLFVSFLFNLIKFYINKGMSKMKEEKTPTASILIGIISFAVYVITLTLYLRA